MKLIAMKTFKSGMTVYRRGTELELADARGKLMVEQGFAKPFDDKPKGKQAQGSGSKQEQKD